MRNKQLILCGCVLLASARMAAARDGNPPSDFFNEAKPIIDARVRFENVDQAGIANEADAATLRARLGVETGKFLSTTLLAEGEFVEPFDSDYNSTVNGKTQFPTVADPKTEEVNRLQLTNTSLPQTTLIVGRQRVNLDDQRFIGNVGWRQNEQTFDAVRAINKSVANFTLDITYLNQANRVFGKDSVQGRYRGDSFLGNVAYQSPIGKFTGFSYLLKFEPLRSSNPATRNQSLNDSTATSGLRFAGSRKVRAIKLDYVASYAHQTDYGDNLLNFENDYYLGEVTLSFKQLSGGLGVEILDGSGVKGFTTPLATLHKFQGWADKFVTTPPNGIDDRYVNLGWLAKSAGPFDNVSAAASYHVYRSQRLSLDYGCELNLLLQAKWRRFTGALKYADYNADGFFTDTTKFWAQVEVGW